MVAVPAGRSARAASRPTACCSEGIDRRLRRVHDPDPEPGRGARPQPQLPCRLGHEGAGCRRPPAERARDRRPRAGRRRPGPTSAGTTRSTPAGGAAAAVVDPARHARSSRSTSGRGSQLGEVGTALTGYTVHARVRRLHLGSARHDERRRRRLGLRAPRRVRLDHRVLGHRPEGDRHQAVDPLLVHSARPPTRRWRCCGGATSTTPTATSTGIRSSIRNSARSSSAAGTSCRRGPTHPLALAARRGRSPRRLRDPPGAVLATARDRPHRRRAAGRRHVARRGRGRQHRLASHRRHRRRPGSSNSSSPAARRCGATASTSWADRPGNRSAHLEGRAALRFSSSIATYGTPDRALVSWVVSAPAGSEVAISRRFLTELVVFRRRSCLHSPVAVTRSPHRPPRVGGDHDHPRGRGRVRAAGAAVLRRQGLGRDAAPRDAGVRPGPPAVPDHARRHRAQLPRADRVPRSSRRATRAAS